MTARALPRPVSPVADLVSLVKPRLSSLVLCTLAGGMWLAPGELSVARWVATLLGTAGTVGAANALNCWLERDRDRFMARTRARPLPSGRMESGVALGFGLLLAVFSLPLLALASNGLTGSLGFLALVSYVWAYTPLKPRSPMAMLVGGIPGSLPPLMGWTAVTGRIGTGGLLLFGILFAWQMPHFLAIALFRKDEYRNAGYMAFPLVLGDDATRIWMLLWTVLLVVLSVLLVPFGVAGPLYLAVALVLGGVFLALVTRGVLRREQKAWARKTFLFSLVYLAGLFAALLLSARAH
ncbi:MAG: protoheme IX farnesyltransferase [Myxococcaceae bacterium]|nr:MAG: protoheme IX farnesyltransferase [Myxococcaceae bacterium]